MFLLGIKYTPLTATLGALILGIGTEFTIPLMMRYYEERGKGKSPTEAMTTAITRIGRAIIASGFTVIGGFAALLIARDFPILDDFGLQRLNAQQLIDLYELIIARHRKSSFIITSNRAVEEWLGVFDDPILGNSALDRLANASYQIVIEGTSYRERLSPHRRRKEGVDTMT